MDWIRAGLDMGVGRWKALLAGLCLLSAVVMGMEGAGAVAALARGTEGRLGLTLDSVMIDGHSAAQVLTIEPWSLAPRAGVQTGDLLLFDRWFDEDRSRLPGEAIPVTVVRGGARTAAVITAAERPIEPAERWHFWLNATLCTLGTLFALAVGLRQAEVRTSRALALTFLWWSMNLGTSYAPPEWPQIVVRVMNEAALMPGWYAGLWFAVHYPDERPQGWRRALRRVLPLFLVALVLVVAASVALALGRLPSGAVRQAQIGYVGAAGALMLVCFWDGWRRSDGALRQRFSWLLGSFALYWAVSYSTWLTEALDASGWRFASHVSVLGSLVALSGLTYAILRHRVLDMGLAINRSLVFAVVGAVLFGSFHFLQVLAGRLLHFDDPAKAGLLSAVLAVLVVLAYPRVKPRAEWLVDRLFFGAWVEREADLTRFAADARGFTDPASLAQALVGAVDRFTNRAGAALYVRDGQGRFVCEGVATLASPAALDADEPLLVRLRAGHAIASADEAHSTLRAELAVVLSRQRELDALVLVGRQRDGRALRADEVLALRDALRTVGAEWQGLRWEAVRRMAHG